MLSRIETLEAQGQLSGVVDDRGKFIYIEKKELQAVADHVQRMGRISIRDLAAKSNTLVDLTPQQNQEQPNKSKSAS